MTLFSCSCDFALYFLKISWINVILGILLLCDTTIDSLTNVGHLDLYFMSSDFALYLECYLMYEHHYLGL